MNANYVVTHKDLGILDACNGYYLVYLPTGDDRCMGDGVDLYEGVTVGTARFYDHLANDLETNYGEWLEAYFPEVNP